MDHFGVFMTMAMILIVTPGADVALVTKNTLTHGRRGGMATALGISTGVLVHTLAAALGLSAILAQSAQLFELVKFAGAAYLIYLGIQALLTARKTMPPDGTREEASSHSARSTFFQGVLSNVFNPKVAIFFLTFLPQFVSPKGPVFGQIVGMGVTYAVMGTLWLFFYTVLLQSLRGFFQRRETYQALQGITGTAMIGLGIKLALEKR
ncbi:LysE family translocator [Brevibacillus sp. SYP-B805]|uniref:LysE family translocator n=1 Tax=Brevibacillus sp. SYP-B805 TaxID=1578199 RepID=UPI0013EC1ADA|nr:LysE family translocator [Brevibacillus sp. SYP-B805]NGQ96863.1 LysE family translocator [Brevibacillus sp. SYP-B805]